MRVSRITSAIVWRVVLAGIAAVLFLRESFAPPAPRFSERADERPVATRPLPPPRLRPTPVLYPAIAAHPLFDPSRQPWVAPAPEQGTSQAASFKPAPAPLRGYVLVGLVTGIHQHSALLRDPFGKTVFLAEGQLLAGWTVHRIDAHGVHLLSGDNHLDVVVLPAREAAFGRR